MIDAVKPISENICVKPLITIKILNIPKSNGVNSRLKIPIENNWRMFFIIMEVELYNNPFLVCETIDLDILILLF
jgi:hypothetical protein